MSDTEYHKGKLRKINADGKTLEEKAEFICRDRGLLIGYTLEDSPYDSYAETIEDELYKKVALIGDDFYSVMNYKQNPDCDIFQAKKNEDESIEYEVKFYNGSMDFNEALDIAFNKI